MKFDVYDNNKKVKDITLSELWDNASDKVIHQVVVARLANERQGTVSTKTRAEVKATGAKPFKQKGTGRARRGSAASPLLRGGGVIFGPKPRDFRQKINKKQKVQAYMAVFKALYEKNALKVVSSFELDKFSTKEMLTKLESSFTNVRKRNVVIVKDYNKKLLASSSNIQKVSVFGADYLDILPLVYANEVLITEDAFLYLDEKYKKLMS